MVMIFDSSEALEVLGKDRMKPKTWPTPATLLLFKTFSSWPVSFSTLACWTSAWKGEDGAIQAAAAGHSTSALLQEDHKAGQD
jgi:hypothetical protein